MKKLTPLLLVAVLFAGCGGGHVDQAEFDKQLTDMLDDMALDWDAPAMASCVTDALYSGELTADEIDDVFEANEGGDLDGDVNTYVDGVMEGCLDIYAP